MSEIFICYRRLDTAGVAGRIYDRLKDEFGEDRLYMDVANTKIGQRWPTRIERSIIASQVILVIIGPHWLDEINRRVHEPDDDWVRKEIDSGLLHQKSIIPVLVDDATMPLSRLCEPALKNLMDSLSMLDPLEITHRDFHDDIQDLIDVLKENGVTPSGNQIVKIHKNRGLLEIHDRFASDTVNDAIIAAQDRVDILTTWITDAPNLEHALETAALNGAAIRILLIDPECDMAKARDAELQMISSELIGKSIIVENRNQLMALYRKLKSRTGKRPQIELKYYDLRPTISLYAADDKTFVGFFLHFSRMVRAPLLEVEGTDTRLGRLREEFGRIWGMANKEVSLEDGSIRSV